MFVVIYRWSVAAGREDQFCAAWSRLTELISRRPGSLGSRLHRTADGEWVAYAQWESLELWRAASAPEEDGEAQQLSLAMRVGAEAQPPWPMEVVEDRLVPRA